jgi:hypothetical protein
MLVVSSSQGTYHLPSAPILTVPIPILPVSVAEIALESLSSPPPFGEVVGLLKIKSSQCLEQFNVK